jgi:hypothetical protein
MVDIVVESQDYSEVDQSAVGDDGGGAGVRFRYLWTRECGRDGCSKRSAVYSC